MVQNTSDPRAEEIIKHLKLLTWLTIVSLALSYGLLFVGRTRMKAVSRQTIIKKTMAHYVNENVERIAEESGITPPYFHFIDDDESVKRELAKCHTYPRLNELVLACGNTFYAHGEAFKWIEHGIGKSPYLYAPFGEISKIYLEFITELGIAKYIARTRLPSLSQVAQTTSAFCLVGQSSFVTHSGSDSQRRAILETHLRISNLIIDDISSRQQLLAFDKGWSGQDCYQPKLMHTYKPISLKNSQ